MAYASALLFACTVLPASTSASWSAPVQVSTGFGAWAAMNSSGEAVAAWYGSSGDGNPPAGIVVAVRPAGGNFGAGQEIYVGSDATIVSVAIADSGDAIVLYDKGGAQYLSTRPPGGSFAAPQPVPGDADSTGSVALDEHGNALAVFYDKPSDSLLYTWRPVAGMFTATHVLGAGGHGPVIAFDAPGRALVAWANCPASGVCPPHTVSWARTSVGVPAGAPQSIAAPANETQLSSLAIAADRTGDALLGWSAFDGNAASLNDSGRTATAVARGGGAFAAPQSASNDPSGASVPPVVAVATDGSMLEAQSEYPAPACSSPCTVPPGPVRVALAPPGGPFGAPEPISILGYAWRAGTNGAFDSVGIPVVIGSQNGFQSTIRLPAQGWCPAETVDSADVVPWSKSLAFDSHGGGVYVWEALRPTRVMASFYTSTGTCPPPPPPPPPPPAPKPAATPVPVGDVISVAVYGIRLHGDSLRVELGVRLTAPSTLKIQTQVRSGTRVFFDRSEQTHATLGASRLRYTLRLRRRLSRALHAQATRHKHGYVLAVRVQGASGPAMNASVALP